MIFPIVSLDCQLTIFSDNKERLFKICDFLKKNEILHHPISKIFPKLKSEIEEDNNFYKVYCGYYNPNFTAMTKMEFCLEYLRLAIALYKNFNLFFKFYIPKIPPNEHDRDFLYITMLSHIFIPRKIVQFDNYTVETSREIFNVSLKNLKLYYYNTFTEIELNILKNISQRTYKSLHSNNILLNGYGFKMLQYTEFFHLIYNQSDIKIKSSIIEKLYKVFKISDISQINTPKYISYKNIEYFIKELFTFSYENKIILVGICKYEKRIYNIFI